MTPNEKDYMDRYIYQVIHRLPKAQREEVRMELEELLSDMYADRGSMEEVLTELGDPAEFAKQYQNEQKYLIGPEYFDTYLWFVKVVLICAAVPILIISLIKCDRRNARNHFAERRLCYYSSYCGRLDRRNYRRYAVRISAFGAVTLTFAIMEQEKDSDRNEEGREMVSRKPV